MPILSVILRSFFGAALLAAIATFANSLDAPRSDEAFSWFVSPEVFEPLAYGALFVVGLLLFSCTRRPSAAKLLALRFGVPVMLSYSAVAGGVAGWGATSSLLQVVGNGWSQLPAALALSGYALLVAVTPLWMYEQVQPEFSSYSSFRVVPRRGGLLLQMLGVTCVFASAYGLLLWMTSG